VATLSVNYVNGFPRAERQDYCRNEFLEIRLRAITPSLTEFTFINGWNGQPLGDEFSVAVRSAWADWLDRMELSVLNRSKVMKCCGV